MKSKTSNVLDFENKIFKFPYNVVDFANIAGEIDDLFAYISALGFSRCVLFFTKIDH